MAGSLAVVSILGGDGDDIISTRTTDLPAAGDFALTLNGGAGNDTHNIGSLSNLRHIPAPFSPNSLDGIGERR